MPDVFRLSTLAEVTHPPADSLGAEFLLSIANDVTERLDGLAERFQADEIPSIAEMALDMPDSRLWDVWTDLRLWEEDVVALVAPGAGMTERAEAALMAVGLRLAVALVAERMAVIELG